MESSCIPLTIESSTKTPTQIIGIGTGIAAAATTGSERDMRGQRKAHIVVKRAGCKSNLYNIPNRMDRSGTREKLFQNGNAQKGEILRIHIYLGQRAILECYSMAINGLFGGISIENGCTLLQAVPTLLPGLLQHRPYYCTWWTCRTYSQVWVPK